MANSVLKQEVSGRVVYCAYIIRNGRRIYPRRAKVFRFIVKA